MSTLSLRQYQRKARELAKQYGLFCMLWRRQGGKSTFLGLQAISWMAQFPGVLVTYASASLLLGREITFKEAQLFQQLIALQAATLSLRMESVDSRNSLTVEKVDDFAECFTSGRLETRLWHDRTTFSRTQVIAPNPATARGFSGFTIVDEISAIRAFREIWDAMEPIFSSSAAYRCLMAMTPALDERHYTHELTAPPIDFDDSEPNADGRVYRSEAGLICHHVTVYDAAAAGLLLYHPETREVLTPEAHRALSLDREAWDRNYALRRATTGTAACNAADLDRAMRAPESSECLASDTDEELTPQDLATLLRRIVGPTGLGLDLATTAGKTSNPTALALTEAMGARRIVRLLWRWKTADPAETLRRVRMLLFAMQIAGLQGKSLWVDASNERFYSTQVREALYGIISVRLVVGGETASHLGEQMRMKELLGNYVTSGLEDGHIALPASNWVKKDFRLVKKCEGLFEADTLADGSHGDSFDGCKLSLGSLSDQGVSGQAKSLRKRRNAGMGRGLIAA